MGKKFGFKKTERLCRRNTIQNLFSEGQSFVKYPFRVSFIKLTDETVTEPVQVLISVSKKRFKRAYKRNLLKRRIREAYRLNKHILTDAVSENGERLAVAFIYLPAEEFNFVEIEKGMIKALQKINKLLESKRNADHE